MIRLFITGGTIDKTYNSLSGELEFERSYLPQMLAQSRTTLEITTEILFLKDSLEISENDRELLVSKCLDCSEKYIIISHGTDTMTDTAEFLEQAVKGKIIVLFGAILPYSVADSDALFNLGVALSAVKNQNNSGIYIAMNGRIFASGEVQKNKNLGIFQAKSDEK
ncbi:MAG: asparaginase [Candidatus Thioglobus sp.]|nr:asparaginase [Candidatus Thioglobus sp.]